MNNHQAAEIREAFEYAGAPVEESRWGHLQTRTPEGGIIRITEDDGTYRFIVLTSSELVDSEVLVSGLMANPVTLAAMVELVLAESR